MATPPTVTFNFNPTGFPQAAQVRTNFDDLVKYISDRNSATASWDSLSVTGASTFATAITITPTTNQIVLGTTRTVTFTAPTPASTSRTVTFPDLSGNYSVVGTTGTQTVSGTKTFDGQLIGKGTATNDDAATGYIGETVSSAITSFTNVPTSGQYGDLTSISLTAGDWLITGIWTTKPTGATISAESTIAIGAVSGNSGTGLDANNQMDLTSSSTQRFMGSIPSYRVKLSGTTTYYLKGFFTYSVATPQWEGRLSAVRIR